jgi:hypothetical protein
LGNYNFTFLGDPGGKNLFLRILGEFQGIYKYVPEQLEVIQHKVLWFGIGLYRTSRQVWKSGEFSKSGLSGNRTFSFPDTGLF